MNCQLTLTDLWVAAANFLKMTVIFETFPFTSPGPAVFVKRLISRIILHYHPGNGFAAIKISFTAGRQHRVFPHAGINQGIDINRIAITVQRKFLGVKKVRPAIKPIGVISGIAALLLPLKVYRGSMRSMGNC